VTIREQVTIRAWVECVGCGRTFEKCAALPSGAETKETDVELEGELKAIVRAERRGDEGNGCGVGGRCVLPTSE
jgi:hypothetical protein